MNIAGAGMWDLAVLIGVWALVAVGCLLALWARHRKIGKSRMRDEERFFYDYDRRADQKRRGRWPWTGGGDEF